MFLIYDTNQANYGYQSSSYIIEFQMRELDSGKLKIQFSILLKTRIISSRYKSLGTIGSLTAKSRAVSDNHRFEDINTDDLASIDER
jgi:hypothetical protein